MSNRQRKLCRPVFGQFPLILICLDFNGLHESRLLPNFECILIKKLLKMTKIIFNQKSSCKYQEICYNTTCGCG